MYVAASRGEQVPSKVTDKPGISTRALAIRYNIRVKCVQRYS
jgi:hypothetical protein